MFGKILITGQIEVITGMHIGTGGDFSAIGAVDSPVIKDAVTGEPIIPGSTLKGKLRSLLARRDNKSCDQSIDKESKELKRLFGYQGNEQQKQERSRLIFSDMYLTNRDELDKIDVRTTEVKFENSINRLTGVANPRQIERAIRGCRFGLELIYELSKVNEAVEDMALLADGMKLLEFDYIGGSGSRGYGKIKFKDIIAETAVGEIDEKLLADINAKLKEVG